MTRFDDKIVEEEAKFQFHMLYDDIWLVNRILAETSMTRPRPR
jgi:hypothetical protein